MTAVHAGPAAAALRDSLGAGADRLVVLGVPGDADPLPALAAWLRRTRPLLVVAGECAETGEGSGMVPFMLSEQMNHSLLTNVVGLQLSDVAVHATQAMAGGRRRVLRAPTPAVVTVGRTAPAGRLPAIARALRGEVRREMDQPAPPDAHAHWPSVPARVRPRPLAAPAIGMVGEGGLRLNRPDPDAAADAILDFLEREGVIMSGASAAPREG